MSFLPAADRAYLAEKGIAYEEKQDGAVKGVILKGRRLPDGRFDSAAADILIQLPPGYPDVAPDIFDGATNAIVYYLPGTTGWGETLGGRPAQHRACFGAQMVLSHRAPPRRWSVPWK